MKAGIFKAASIGVYNQWAPQARAQLRQTHLHSTPAPLNSSVKHWEQNRHHLLARTIKGFYNFPNPDEAKVFQFKRDVASYFIGGEINLAGILNRLTKEDQKNFFGILAKVIGKEVKVLNIENNNLSFDVVGSMIISLKDANVSIKLKGNEIPSSDYDQLTAMAKWAGITLFPIKDAKKITPA